MESIVSAETNPVQFEASGPTIDKTERDRSDPMKEPILRAATIPPKAAAADTERTPMKSMTRTQIRISNSLLLKQSKKWAASPR